MDFEVPEIVWILIIKICYTDLTDIVSIVETILRSLMQIDETDAIIQDISSLIFEILEIIIIYLCRRSFSVLDRLSEVIHKEIFDQIDKATS